MFCQNSNLEWINTPDGSQTLYHPEYQETYHSKQGAYGESRFVYLNPALEFVQNLDVIHVLDVGFGLGVNWLVWMEWALQSQKKVCVHSLEKQADILLIPSPRMPVADELMAFLENYKKNREFSHKSFSSYLHVDEALLSLQNLAEQGVIFDVVLQDPFSPQKNPDCWNEDYFKTLDSVLQKQALVLSYSVAKVAVENLQKIGFQIQKNKGFAGKRNQLLAIRS